MSLLAIWRAFQALPAIGRVAIIAAGCAIAFLVWLNVHDGKVIAAHDAMVNTETAQAVTRADRAANAADAAREEQRRADSAETREAIDNAEANYPDEVRRPAGPALRAAADSLRRRADPDRRATP